MLIHSKHVATGGHRASGDLLHSTRALVRTLESVAARHRGHHDVVAVCHKWAARVAELERQAISAGIGGTCSAAVP